MAVFLGGQSRLHRKGAGPIAPQFWCYLLFMYTLFDVELPMQTWHVYEGSLVTLRAKQSGASVVCIRRGSCHMPVFTWRPSIPSRRSSSVERATAQCHLRTIFVLIPPTAEDISFPATTASIRLITVSLSALALSTTLILANGTELNFQWPSRSRLLWNRISENRRVLKTNYTIAQDLAIHNLWNGTICLVTLTDL